MVQKMNLFRKFERWFIKGLIYFVAKYYLKRPDQAEIIFIKISTFRVAFYSFLNEMCYILGLSRSFRLMALNFEVTNSCNFSCQMCPVNHGMVRKKGFMDFDLFKKIIDSYPHLEFVLCFQWGEPLLHPRIFDMIDYAYEKGIRSMITSNGSFLTDEHINRILNSRLERITFSVDGVGRTHEKIRGYSYDKLKADVTKLRQERDRRGASLKIDTSMVVWDDTEPDVEAYFQEWRPISDRLQLVPRLTEMPRKHKCRELWRGQMVVLWDGRVSACCVDYEGCLIVGDANTESVKKIWNGPKLRALRKAHAKGRFSGICKDCGEYHTEKVSPRFS